MQKYKSYLHQQKNSKSDPYSDTRKFHQNTVLIYEIGIS